MHRASVVLVVGLIGALALAAGKAPAPAASRDAGPAPARDMAVPPAAKVSRSISDAWNYNRLQHSVVESQRDRLNAELARLEAERAELAAHLKADYQTDVAAGDTFDERTLEIHRRAP